MFGKEKGKENEVQPVVNKPVSKDVKTLIGEGCRVDGNIFVPTTARIDGTITGDLKGDSGIIVGNTGKIEGNLTSPEVIVYGSIKGNIECDKLELKRGSDVSGDISVSSFITEQGAKFNGKCKMKSPMVNIEPKITEEQPETTDVKIVKGK
jgi:cytoskeletal protein CcmA (bactofilin family)